MKLNALTKAVLIPAVTSVLLVGCGGGSGGSSTPSKPTNPVEPPTKPVDPPTKPAEPPVTPTKPAEPPVTPTDPVEPPVIPPKEDEEAMSVIGEKNHPTAALAASNELSLQRQACGLSGLEYDQELTDISLKHAEYMAYAAKNNKTYGMPAHSEAQFKGLEDVTGINNPFFTGVTFSDRIYAANYNRHGYSASENINEMFIFSPSGNAPTPSVKAVASVRGLLAAPYHLQALVHPDYKYTGSSIVSYVPFGNDKKEQIAYKFVNSSAGPKGSGTDKINGVFTYPCGGVTGTVTALYNESPNPVAGTGRNLGKDPIGQPVYVYVPSAKEIKVSNVKIFDAKRNQSVPIEILDSSSDPHKGTVHQMAPNKAFILPITDDLNSCPTGYRKNCGLYPQTKYTVSFDVLADNKTAYKEEFEFTTGYLN